MKYYKIVQGKKRRVSFIKVWDKIPDNEPECFKKSKLIYKEELEIKFFRPLHYDISKISSFCDGKTLDLELKVYGAILITEEDYNKAEETFMSLADTCSSTFDELKSV